jgi:hypothetical protein
MSLNPLNDERGVIILEFGDKNSIQTIIILAESDHELSQTQLI